MPEKIFSVEHEILMIHVAEHRFQLPDTAVPLFCSLTVQGGILHIAANMVALAASSMVVPVQSVHQKLCVTEKVWTAVQAVQMQTEMKIKHGRLYRQRSLNV